MPKLGYRNEAARDCSEPRFERPKIVTTFDKREEAFEKKFSIDEDLRFKAMVRRSRLIGLYVAEKLGRSGPDADAYAKEVVAAEVDGGDEGVVKKLLADAAARGIEVTEANIRAKMAELLAIAVAQVKAGT
jgi:hypothetical protein